MTAPFWVFQCVFSDSKGLIHGCWKSFPHSHWEHCCSMWSRRQQGKGRVGTKCSCAWSWDGPSRQGTPAVHLASAFFGTDQSIAPESQLLAGPFENGLKSHCSHILFYEHHQGRKEKKNSIHEMERQRILINSIIGAKAIMLHVLWSPPEKWEWNGKEPRFWLVSFPKHLNIRKCTSNQQQYSQGCPKVDIEEQGARKAPSI